MESGATLPQGTRPSRAVENLSLSFRAVAVAVAICVIGGAFVATFFIAQRYTRQAHAERDLIWQRLLAAQRTETGALHVLDALRNALVQADPALVPAYERALADYALAAASLRALALADTAGQARLGAVDTLMTRWQAAYAAPVLGHLLGEAQRSEPRADDEALRTLLAEMAHPIERIGDELEALRAADTERLQQRDAALAAATRRAAHVVLAVALFGLFCTWAVFHGLRHHVAIPLSRLTALIPRISVGETALQVPYTDRREEVGTFARSLVQLGEVVQERSEADWIKTQVTAISTAVQHAVTHEQLADALLRPLCATLQAGYGVAYRWDEEAHALLRCGAYALPEEASARARFELGQGLVGQAATEQAMLLRSPPDADSFRMLTAVGSVQPQTILALPLIARDELVAAIEIGLVRPPTPRELQLLRELPAMVALSWQALARNLKTLALLRTTQSQAAELRASQEAMRVQQEELRSTNETLRERSQLLEEQKRRLKASEEELRAQAEELRVTNGALTEKSEALRLRQEELERSRHELERRARELETASRYKSEFLANMSHELRTPLNSLLILSKGLADNEFGHLDADEVESAQVVYESGKSLLNLINDILDLSKVEAGKMQLVLEDVDLDEFAAMQERNFRHVAHSRGLHFEVIKESGLPHIIHSDGTRLGQVVVNMLSNAFKFTQQGEVTLTIGRPNAASTLRMPGLDPAKAVYFAVTDTGIGIPEEELEHIFLPFEQADGSISRRYGGTGLGLSIVRGMAQLLGGEVQVQSEVGVGSMFMLIIPEQLADPDAGVSKVLERPALPPPSILRAEKKPTAPLAAPLPAVAASPRAAAGGESAILVVEDDPAFAKVLRDIVTRKGQRAILASTGEAALRVAAERPLAGVLLDLGLPDTPGWQVLERLKNDARTRHIPVHVISANEESSRALAMGAVGFLVKPVTREAVLGALDRVAHFRDGRRRRLLLIDDDAAARLAVRRLLDAEDLDIVEAHDAAAGLKALSAADAFDCVILDLGLPDISGFELLDRAAQLGRLPPVVVYSGRELTPEEALRLREHTESIVIKGVRSPERLLDEVSLFLHAVHKPGGAPPIAAPEAPAADVAGKTALVVDDDMRNVFALSKALRARGLKVLMAQDGHKALAQLEGNESIDIVLMDIMMPGMDGYETMRRIRADARWRELPIIALTAKAMKGDRERCLEAGANDYCSKPIDVDQLMSQVRVWIR